VLASVVQGDAVNCNTWHQQLVWWTWSSGKSCCESGRRLGF